MTTTNQGIMMNDEEVIDTYRMGYSQHWAGTPEHCNPFLMGQARRDQDQADLFTAGWRAAQREAQAVDAALERMGAEG